MAGVMTPQRPVGIDLTFRKDSTEDEEDDGSMSGRSSRRRSSQLQNWLEDDDFLRMDMFTAASIGNLESVKEIITRGEEDVNAKNDGGWTALMYAAYIGHDNVCRFLVDSGARSEITNSRGMTPLMLAATCGNDKTCKLLLEYQANLCARDPKGWTALFYATFSNHLNVVKVMVKSGGDPNEPDEEGITPFLLSALAGHELLVDLFLTYGADTGYTTPNGETARSLATARKKMKVLMMLDAHRQGTRHPTPMDGPIHVASTKPAYPIPPSNDLKKKEGKRETLSQNAVRKPSSEPIVFVSEPPKRTLPRLPPENGQANEARPNSAIPDSIQAIMKFLDLEKYTPQLIEGKITSVPSFLALTDEDLKAVGIKLLGPRKKIVNAIRRWSSDENPG